MITLAGGEANGSSAGSVDAGLDDGNDGGESSGEDGGGVGVNPVHVEVDELSFASEIVGDFSDIEGDAGTDVESHQGKARDPKLPELASRNTVPDRVALARTRNPARLVKLASERRKKSVCRKLFKKSYRISLDRLGALFVYYYIVLVIFFSVVIII